MIAYADFVFGTALGAILMFAAACVWLYHAMRGEIYETPEQHASDDSYSFAPLLMSSRAERAGDITFDPAPTHAPAPQPPRKLSDFFGEQLVFESICGARNLHSVFAAYAMADASRRRPCSRDQRMFYDACLGATVRGLIDEHRARNPEPVTQTPEAIPAASVNTPRH